MFKMKINKGEILGWICLSPFICFLIFVLIICPGLVILDYFFDFIKISTYMYFIARIIFVIDIILGFLALTELGFKLTENNEDKK